MLHQAVGAKYATVARTMEAAIAGEVSDRTAQMSADRAGYGKPLIAITKDEDLLLHQKRRRPEGIIGGIANLEGLRRLIKNARHQKPYDRPQADTYRRDKGS